ncbi:hypothetical protein ABZP36_000668 [Zizania latifolia]
MDRFTAALLIAAGQRTPPRHRLAGDSDLASLLPGRHHLAGRRGRKRHHHQERGLVMTRVAFYNGLTCDSVCHLLALLSSTRN